MMRARRLTLAVFAATLGLMACSAGTALAAAPEAPVTEPATGVTTTTATLHGVLNPAASAKVHWSFAYSPEPFGPECVDAFRSTDEEAEGQALPETVELTELEANRKYTACLTASNEEGETRGNEVTFQTPPAPPKVDNESVLVTPVGATLEALLNPNNEKTAYFFEYSTSEAEVLAGKGTKVLGAPPAAELEGGSDQTASVPTGSVLAPGTTYFYRVIAENEQSTIEGKPAKGAVKEFTTVPSPFTEAVTEITATGATFNGTLTPLSSVDTTYAFDYKLLANGPECTGENTTNSEDAGTGTGSKSVSTKTSEQAIELQPNATYSVCVVSSNAFGSVTGQTVSFLTEPAPPKIDSQTAFLTPSGITLEAQVNPNNLETSYAFEYATSKELVENGEGNQAHGTTTLAGFGDQPASVLLQSVLAPATTYYYRATASNGAGTTVESTVESFTTPPPPLLTVGQAQSITRTTATLPGTVNPEGLETSYYYQYGSSTSYGGNAPAIPGKSVGFEPGAVPATIGISGLVPATTYHYRLAATNADGTTFSPDQTFTTAPPTAPTVSTGEASSITLTTATVAGTINPEGLETAYELDLGVDTTYGTSIYGQAGSAATPTEVSLGLQNLAPASTYHYRMVAINSDGRTYGADRTFTTPAYSNPITQPFTLPLIASPAIAFPTQTANTATGPAKPLTNKQKLAKALKACHKKHNKSKRQACERQAKRKYGAVKGKGKGKK